MTRRREAFLDFYFGAALLNQTEAARLAGFRHPRTAGSALLKKLGEVVDARLVTWKAARIMGPDEVLERLTSLARNDQHKDHFNALTTIAKINGQLSEKLLLSLDRKQLHADFEAELARHAALLPADRSMDVKSNGASQVTEPPMPADRGPTPVRR